MATPFGFCEVWFGFLVAGDNEVMYTHMGYELSSAVTQVAVDAGFADFQTEFRVLWNSEMTLLGGHVIEGAPGGGARWDYMGTSVTGSAGGLPSSNNTAILVKKSSAFGGRRNRGRMFFPCPQEGHLSGAGILSAAAITAWSAELPELLPGGGVHTAFGFLGDAVIFHEEGSQTPTVVTSLTVSNKAATQRRRMRR